MVARQLAAAGIHTLTVDSVLPVSRSAPTAVPHGERSCGGDFPRLTRG
jgi:hypothetical protein